MSIETKSEETKNTLTNLILGIVFLVLGLAIIVAAFLLNMQAANKEAWFIYVMYIVGSLGLLAASGELYYVAQNKFNIKKMNVKQMCVIGIFSALSVVLYYYAKFNLPFFPSWLDIQFSDVPAILTTFMYGPLSGCIMILVRFVCKLPGTSTMAVGEFADLLIGCTLCIVIGLIYRKHKSIKGALVATAIGMASATVVACLANWLILIPAYVEIAGFPWVALVGAMDKLVSATVTKQNFMQYYIFAGVLPFNLFRYTLVFLITFILYKRLHILINIITGNKEDNKKSKKSAEKEPEELEEATEE